MIDSVTVSVSPAHGHPMLVVRVKRGDHSVEVQRFIPDTVPDWQSQLEFMIEVATKDLIEEMKKNDTAHRPALEALVLDPWARRDRLRDRMDILEVGRMGDER
jgi:hypothetical protein